MDCGVDIEDGRADCMIAIVDIVDCGMEIVDIADYGVDLDA